MRPVYVRSSVVVASTLLSLLLAEFIVHAFFKLRGLDITTYQPSAAYNEALADGRRFVSHPFLPYAPRPGDKRTLRVFRPETNRTYTYEYSTNALGFRTPDKPFEKPAGVKRIVCLGGSTTADGFTDAETWPARLEARLRARGMNVEVFNLGVDMASSPTSLIDLEFIGLEYRPDLVISYDGVNDTNLLGFEGESPDYRNVYAHFNDSYRTWQSMLPRWAFRSYLVTLVSSALDRGTRSDVGSQVIRTGSLKRSADALDGVHLYERNLKLMRAASREYGARFLAATAHWERPDEKVNALNSELRRFYESEGIDYVDLDSQLPRGDWLLHVDSVHWTREGIESVAKSFEEKIIAERLL